MATIVPVQPSVCGGSATAWIENRISIREYPRGVRAGVPAANRGSMSELATGYFRGKPRML